MKKRNVREAALDLLLAIEKKQAYSHLQLKAYIEKHDLSPKDIGLLTELVYGTIQRKMTLDYYLSHFLKTTAKLSDWVIPLLRISLYQMVYLDRIPDRAVLYEAVEIAKKRGHPGIASFVNGVLRNVQRKGLPPMDVIFCRNVLIYFDQATCRQVIKCLSHKLADGGYLFLGHAETLAGCMEPLHMIHKGSSFFYRKGVGHLGASRSVGG